MKTQKLDPEGADVSGAPLDLPTDNTASVHEVSLFTVEESLGSHVPPLPP